MDSRRLSDLFKKQWLVFRYTVFGVLPTQEVTTSMYFCHSSGKQATLRNVVDFQEIFGMFQIRCNR